MPCTSGVEDKSPDQITIHAPLTCTFYYSPPPPPPLFPPDTEVEEVGYATEVQVVVKEEPTDAELNAMKENVKEKAGCTDCYVTIDVITKDVDAVERRRLVTAYILKIQIVSTTP